MSTWKENYGKHVQRHLTGFCPECSSTVFLAPGPLNDDGTIEIRTCEDGHPVESEPSFWAAPSEATEFEVH